MGGAACGLCGLAIRTGDDVELVEARQFHAACVEPDELDGPPRVSRFLKALARMSGAGASF